MSEINLGMPCSYSKGKRVASMSGVDTGAVFKHLVHCFTCEEAFYFTLRKIAEAKTLRCPQCGSNINLADGVYKTLVTEAKETIALIDDFQQSFAQQRRLSPV
jgi:DNA-directed RNA polymerase subunit RPC12/RpoP